MHLDVFSYLHAPSFIHAFSCARSESVRARRGLQNIEKRNICENSGLRNKMFAHNVHAGSRGKTCVGVTVAQSWSESVFPLSLECPLDWREFLGFGVTAAPHPVTLYFTKR